MTDHQDDDDCPFCTALFAARDLAYSTCAGLVRAYALARHLNAPDIDALDQNALIVLSGDLGVLQLIENAIGRDLTGHPDWLATWIDMSDELAAAVIEETMH